jgi:hypothetical protein
LLLYVVTHRQHIFSCDLICHPHTGRVEDSYIFATLPKLRRLRGVKVQLEVRNLTSMPNLTAAAHLTRLVLVYSIARLQPGALASLSQMQHLAVIQSKILSDSDPEFQADPAADRAAAAAGMAQLLDDLPQLQQLTYLDLGCSRATWVAEGALQGENPQAYSALTASSRLQHLDLSNNCLPAGVWEHIFPSGRQLPHLKTLDISWVVHPRAGEGTWAPIASLPGALIASCCPALQTLRVKGMKYSTEGLAPLQQLSSLWELVLVPRRSLRDRYLRLWRAGQVVLPKLTGLRRLSIVGAGRESEGLLLQLSALRQLTQLTYIGRVDGGDDRLFFGSEVSDCGGSSQFTTPGVATWRPFICETSCYCCGCTMGQPLCSCALPFNMADNRTAVVMCTHCYTVVLQLLSQYGSM